MMFSPLLLPIAIKFGKFRLAFYIKSNLRFGISSFARPDPHRENVKFTNLVKIYDKYSRQNRRSLALKF